MTMPTGLHLEQILQALSFAGVRISAVMIFAPFFGGVAVPARVAADTAAPPDTALSRVAPRGNLEARANQAQFPRYDLTIEVDTAGRTLTGRVHATIVGGEIIHQLPR